jgi:signal transduction histidine kinase
MDTITPTNASRSLQVLLVEDSVDDAELVSRELTHQGYAAAVTRVDTRAELERALAAGRWDVVLCEHRLPALDALAVLGAIHARGLDVPFIIVASAISEASAIHLMRAGAHDFLYKNGLGKLGAVIERETCEASLRAERRQMQQQLVLADRLSSVGMLAAGVAHEINNPLSYVLGNLDFALGRLLPGESLPPAELADVLQALGQAREGSARIGRISRDLRVFCRGEVEGTVGPVNVRRVMESSISIAWNQLRHRAKLTRQFERVPAVRGDENRLGQVFLNLLVNAAQALPEGRAEQNEIVVVVRVDRGNVLVEVKDSGQGMSPEHLTRIFEPFFTTKAPGVGSGIGLSICRSILTEMGGEITCESRQGVGTTFRVVLPTLDAAVYPTVPPPRELPRLPPTRILMVDDEPALCAVVRRLLRGEHEVVGIMDGRDALDLLEHDSAFDVVICDVMMPHVSGSELFLRVQSGHPELAERFVFMTGGVFDPQVKQFLRTVANPVLEKPFETRALYEAIGQVLERKAVSGTWPAAPSLPMGLSRVS